MQVRPLALALGAPSRTVGRQIQSLTADWKEFGPSPQREGWAFLPSCDETAGDFSGSGERIDLQARNDVR